MSDLNPFRERIDAIDQQLLVLLNERAQIAREIGAVKEREGLPVYSPEREENLLRSLEARSEGPLSARSIRAIYREIMSASLSLEKDLMVACSGLRGEMTHQAAVSKFGSSVEYSFTKEIADTFDIVAKNQADCGVVPIENPEHGAVGKTLDCLAKHELSVCAEIRLGNSDSEAANRFFVLGRTANPPSGDDRSFLLLRLEDKPGSLASVLEPFVDHGINLTQFASRPAGGGSTDIHFFAEAKGHLRDLLSNDLVRDLSKRCRAVKILGSYPSAARAPDGNR